MTNLFQKYIVLSGAFLLFGLAVLFAGGVSSDRVRAAENASGPDERLLTIYDGTENRGILTRATTLRQAFKEAGIPVDSSDLVEPGLDETLAASIYDVNIYRARPVTVIDGAVRKKIMSAYRTPEQIVAHAGIELQKEDLTAMSLPTDFASEGAAIQLTISRAAPFTFVIYGKTMTAYTQAKTVADMLKEKNVTLSDNDTLSVPLTAPIKAGMTVELWRDGKQTVTEEQDVAFDVEKIRDMDREIGYIEIKTPGVAGKRTVTFEIEMKGGVEVGRKEIQSVITKEPVKQVEVVGAKPKGAYTTPSENETITWNYLTGQGFTREQTAGIMGNLKQENSFNTSGDGIAQWTGGRKAALMSRPDPYNIYTQLDFMMSELNGAYRSVQANIRACSSVECAVVAFQNGYEKCGVCAESRRIQYAYNILASH